MTNFILGFIAAIVVIIIAIAIYFKNGTGYHK